MKTQHIIIAILVVLAVLALRGGIEGFKRCPCGRPYPYKCPYECPCKCHITGVC